MKKAFRISRKIALFVLTLVFVLIGIGVIPNISITKNPNKITLSADTWNSDLAEINKGTAPNTTTYVSISDYVTLNENGLVTAVKEYSSIKNNKDNTVIKIETGLDLYYFSELCNPWFSSGNENKSYTDFLTFNYVLGANINYEDASQTFKMLRPIGWNGDYSFSGNFDGLGHTISNIFYRPFESEEEADNYNGLIYLALFSVNTGTIKNVGIINPNMIQYDLYEGINYATPFIGLNKNLVENCYVQDLRGNNAGMSAEGGYITTMFAAANSAPYSVIDPIDNKEKEIIPTIKNCYVAVDRITSPTIAMTSTNNRYPFVEVNSGIMEHCYFDGHILDLNTTYNKTKEIPGLTSLQTTEFLDQTKFEYYLKNEDEIVDQIWFSNATYKAEYSSYLKLKYPVLRGFETTVFNDEEYFVIEDANDLVLMSEYIDQYQAFRTASYLLVNSVDLNTVSENAFIFTDAVFSGKLIGTTNNSDGYSVELADGTTSNHTSIFNLKINKGNSYNGYRAYGLFSVLSGTVENINLVNVTINESDITDVNLSEINTLGAVCGLLEGGTVNNVNVEVNITLTNGTTTYLGTQQVGGITGTILDGTISNSTTTGTLNAATYANQGTLIKDDSHSIGGIVGKVESCDSINNCLNDIEINNISYSTNPGTAVRQYIGGVIGCAGNDDEEKDNYISNTYELQNNNVINVNNGTYYSLVYVGGIIGRVIDAKGSNGVYLNNANINYNVTDNNYKAYISGVMNVISKVADKYDTFSATGLTYQTVQNELNNQIAFEFTSLSNGGLLNISNSLTNAKYPAKYSIITTVSNGIDIRTAGITYSYLTKMNALGGYNLNYHYERNGSTLKEVANNPQEIDVSMIDEFAPTFNADNKVAFENNELGLDTNYLSVKTALQTTVNLERVYNFADLNYVTHGEVNSYMMQLSGCVNGRNFNLKNIRNDGDIKVYFTDDASALSYRQQTYGNYFSDHKKLKIFGVMEEVSLNHRAEDIYNGGNITFSSQTGIAPNYNLYIAGICYKNVGNDDTSTQKLLLERGYVGSLHNAVNNGDIRTTNGNILENDNLVTPCTVYGYSRIGGITCINSSTISQTFNLGDLYNVNHIQAPSGNSNTTRPNDGHFEVETGGICYIMQNEEYDNSNRTTRGNIIDSANNGTVIAMNTAVESEVGNDENGFTNAGGFVARNDRGEDGYRVDETASIVQNSHISKIQYSINYGDVYAYNAIQGVKYQTEQQSKAAGFVCLGACTIVDAINYGNIYGNSVSAGIFGYLYISRMRTAGMGPNSPIYIANSVNYGQVKVLRMTDNNKANIPVCRSTNYKPEVYDEIPTTGNTANGTTIRTTGALIGVWAHRNNDDDLNSMIIKYLINFVDDLNILGLGVNNYGTSNAVITSKYNMLENMATTNPNDTSPAPFDTDNNNHRYGIKSYYKDSSAGNKSLADIYSQAYNGGIFNENYSIRTPGELTYDANGNVDQNDTDNFIADYIQFVPYSKVNEYLIEKIGLKEVVEENAYANAQTNVELIKQVLIAKNPGKIEDVYNEILSQNQTLVELRKNKIADAIVEYLQENPDKADDVAKVLVKDSAAVKQILTASEIQTIILKLLNNLSETEINQELVTAINTYGLDGLVNDKNNYHLINTILDKFAIQENISNSEKTFIINIFNELVKDGACINAYINSLSEDQKESLADTLYSLVQNDQEFIETIADTYFANLVVEESKFEDLKKALITDRLNNNTNTPLSNYPISNDEYISMYNDLNLSLYSNEDVENAINSLTSNGLDTLLSKIEEQVNGDTTSDMYQYLESGRVKASGIYLRANQYNYVAIINSTNFSFINNSGTTANGQNYTGNINGIDDEETEHTHELYIKANSWYKTSNYYDAVYGWSISTRTNDGKRIGEFNTTSRNNGVNNTVRNSYFDIVGLRLSNSSMINANNYYHYNRSNNQDVTVTDWPNNVNNFIRTGVYGVAANNNNYSRNYSDVYYYDYIEYGYDAVAKNNGNLTHEMIDQMIYEADTNNNDTFVKAYLYKIYINSDSDKAPFLKLLFPNSSTDVNITTALTELNNNLTIDNINVVLNNISEKTAQGNIVKLLHTNSNYYIDILPQMLKELNATNNYSAIVNLVGDIYEIGYQGNSSNMDDYIKSILLANSTTLWDGLSLDEKKSLLAYYYATSNSGVTLIQNAVNNGLLETVEYNRIVKQLLIADIYNLDEYRESLSAHLDADIMAEIAAIIVASNTSLFTKYTGLTEAGIIEQLNGMGVDSSIVTDFTGIYALASSMGIEAGLFLPDNISLIELDKYYTNEDGILVNDPSWRGGTYEDPNKYTEGVRSVNYKVYYEMKQLKKSIATIIFKMELTDEKNEYVVDNNLEYDYFCNYKEKDQYGNPITDADGNHIIKNEVYFYIPINNDILYQDKLIINPNKGSYELSYGASFDEETNKFEIVLRDTYIVGEVLEDTFVVQAEDTRVKTKYTLYVTITNPAYLNPLTSVVVDGNNSTHVDATGSGSKGEVITNTVVNTAVKGYNGKIVLNYGTANMNNGLSLLSNVHVYKTELTTLPTTVPSDFSSYLENELVLGKDYIFNNTINNGIVVIAGQSGTGFNNNGYPSGTVFFDISLDNYQTKGIYLIEIEINESTKYYALFEKAVSSEANLNSLSFNGQSYLNSGTENNNSDQNSISKIEFGTRLDEDFFAYDGDLSNDLTFASLNCVLNANYFDNLDKVHIYKNGDSNLRDVDQSYRIALQYDSNMNRYMVSGKYSSGYPTSVSEIDFDYLIMIPNSHNDYRTFNSVEIGDIAEIDIKDQNATVKFKEQIYLDSILTSPLSTIKIGDVNATKVNGSYQYTIEIIITAEDGVTSNIFTHYITEETYNTYIYRVFVNGGVEVDEILGDEDDEQNKDYIYEPKFEREETPSYRFEYMLDQFYTTNNSSYFKVQFFDAEGNKIDTPEGVTVVVTEGLDFEVEFSSDAESTDYYFAMVYSHEIPFKTGQTNSWNVTFDKIHITKNKNRDSYLDNITFFSESVTASIRTMITVDEIDLETYQGMLADPYREIVCLPGQIYYNQFEWSYEPDTMTKQDVFYVIGLVNKTELDYYTPDFTLPEGATIYRTETVGGVVYRYVPYYVDDLQSLTIFLVSEDGTSIKDTNGADITVTDAQAGYTSFKWDDPADNKDSDNDKGVQTYTLSPVAGYQTIVYDGKTIDNISLRTDFNEFGSYSEELLKFNFVNYRVYSEMYSKVKTDDYFTDYKVAAQDLTNNVKFNIIIDYLNDNSTQDASDITNLVNNVFVELACYALPADVTEKNPPVREEYKPYNKAGIFAYFENGTNVLTHGTLKSNTSGYYNLYVSLPDGYDVTFTVTDKKVATSYPAAGEFYVQSAITARTIDVHITIKKVTPSNDDWGVHIQENSNKK